MKIHILSDLHLEFGGFEVPEVDRDVLIIAGDLHVGGKGIDFIKQEAKKSPIVYVLGNHEFYNFKYEKILDFWNRVEIDNFYFLEKSACNIQGWAILGTTLWTNLEGLKLEVARIVGSNMNDYHIITYDNRTLTPEDTFNFFTDDLRWLNHTLERVNKEKTIVVTHHLPSYRSIGGQYRGSPLNPAFASDLDSQLLRWKIPLWIHGHTHLSFDYRIEDTRILCNPRGYVNYENNAQFKPDFIIDI